MGAGVSVCYLARRAEGVESIRRFVGSYRTKRAGYDHDLVVIYKGFDEQNLQEGQAEFADLPHQSVMISDEHFDIGAYLHAASQIKTKYVCFFNSHSEILADDWLLHLTTAVTRDRVGIAGASGSYESLYDSLAASAKAVWLAGTNYPYDQQLADHYRYVIEPHAPAWLLKKPKTEVQPDLGKRWDLYWRDALAPGGVYEFLRGFRRFPNVHIRSNAFIINREMLLEFFPSIEPTKNASYAFESGPRNLSSRVLDLGRKLVIVDRHGEVYEPADWPKSGTFRLGDQQNLMISDNQTRSFVKLSAAERATLSLLSWGDSTPDSSQAYQIGIRFNVNAPPAVGYGEADAPIHYIGHADYGVSMEGSTDFDAWQRRVEAVRPRVSPQP